MSHFISVFFEIIVFQPTEQSLEMLVSPVINTFDLRYVSFDTGSSPQIEKYPTYSFFKVK